MTNLQSVSDSDQYLKQISSGVQTEANRILKQIFWVSLLWPVWVRMYLNVILHVWCKFLSRFIYTKIECVSVLIRSISRSSVEILLVTSKMMQRKVFVVTELFNIQCHCFHDFDVKKSARCNWVLVLTKMSLQARPSVDYRRNKVILSDFNGRNEVAAR